MQNTRLKLILDYPFFGSLALTLKHVEDTRIATCWTDGKTLSYNPNFINNLTPNEKLFLYLHEICHIILGHSVRRNGRDPKLWNIAGDHAVNLLLRDSVDLPRPEGGLMDTQYINMTAEQIYDKLNQEFSEEERQEAESDQNQNNQNSQEESEYQEEEQENQNDNTLELEPHEDPELENQRDGHTDQLDDNIETSGDYNEEQEEEETQGGEADGEPEESDLDQEIENNTELNSERIDRIERYREMIDQMERFGSVEDVSEEEGLTESDIEGTVSMIDRMMDQNSTETPEPIKRLIKQHISSRIPWQILLARFIHKSCEVDYNWARPNKRYRNITNIIMPTIETQNELSIAIIIDTSGSIDMNLLNLFMSEFLSLLSSIEYSKLYMMSCCNSIFNPQSFNKGEIVDYEPVGDGQTQFAPAFEYINKMQLKPACIIYFTDLYSDDFGPPPGIPVLWVGNYDQEWYESHKRRVPFGEIITMYKEENNIKQDVV